MIIKDHLAKKVAAVLSVVYGGKKHYIYQRNAQMQKGHKGKGCYNR